MQLLATTLLSFTLGSVASAQSDSMVVTLLGTGTPNPRIEHLGPSTLVEAGGQRLLFDIGRGTTIRFELSVRAEGNSIVSSATNRGQGRLRLQPCHFRDPDVTLQIAQGEIQPPSVLRDAVGSIAVRSSCFVEA